ncbi:MAG: hypothetical protein LUB61_06675 [Eggerthellaceae bacterium]|nr:hypothetical protein [Eggerthellaceae bacterium]
MVDRVVENQPEEAPELPEILQRTLVFALTEARDKLIAGEEVVPFTCLVVKDNLFLEEHPGETPDECFEWARHTVEGARGADAYAFCYDGYLDTNMGIKDALIAEGGIPGEDEGYAVAFLYETDDEGKVDVSDTEAEYIGTAPNFMSGLKESSEYSEDEIDEIYTDVDDVDEIIVEQASDSDEIPAPELSDEGTGEVDAGIPDAGEDD